MSSWPDEENTKKADISFEYLQQKNREVQGEKVVMGESEQAYKGDIMSFKSKDDYKNLDFQGRVSKPSKKNF